MNRKVIGKLGMEGGNKEITLSCGNCFTVNLGKNVHTVICTADIRCTDKYHRNFTQTFKLSHSIKASELSAVSIAFCSTINQLQTVAW
mgnify:CR=1 FL=1